MFRISQVKSICRRCGTMWVVWDEKHGYGDRNCPVCRLGRGNWVSRILKREVDKSRSLVSAQAT